MKKQISKNTTPGRNSQFSKHFRMKLKQNRKLFAVTLLLQLLGLPLYLFSVFMEDETDNWYMKNMTTDFIDKMNLSYQNQKYIYENGSRISLIMLIPAILFGAVIALKSFSYLFRKSKTDIDMSLPLNKNQLFFADFLSGLFSYTVPLVIISLLSCLMGFFLGMGNETIIVISLNCAEILIAMIYLYTFSVLISVCCGKLTDAVVYLILSNIAVYILCVSVYSFRNSFIPNLWNDGKLPYEFTWLCPAGAISHIRLLYVIGNMDYLYDQATVSKEVEISWIIWCLIISSLCFLVSFIAFRKRKAEGTGKTITAPALFHAVVMCFTAGIIYTVCSHYKFHRSNFTTPDIIKIILAVTFSLIIFFILFFFRKRRITTQGALKSMIFPVAATCISLIVYIVCINAEGFGLMYYIPDPSDIVEAGIHSPVWPNDYGPDKENIYTAKDDIKRITDLNRELNNDLRATLTDPDALDNYASRYPEVELFRTDYDDKNTHRYGTDDSIKIAYRLKNGKEFERSYTPCVTDLSEYSIFISDASTIMLSLRDKSQDFMNFLKNNDYELFCGNTDFTEKLYGRRFQNYITSNDHYPKEYVVKEYDEELFNEIVSKAYYPYYFDIKDCYVFGAITPNPGIGNNTWQLFLPAEYSDLYEKFMKSAKTEKVKWYKTDTDGNSTEIVIE